MGSVFCCKIENILGLDFVCQNHRQLRYGGTELIGICRAVVHKQENFNSIYDVEVSISAVAVLRLCVKEPRLILKHQSIALGMSDRPEDLLISFAENVFGKFIGNYYRAGINGSAKFG